MQRSNISTCTSRLARSFSLLVVALLLLQGCSDPVSPVDRAPSDAAVTNAGPPANTPPGQAAGQLDETIADIAGGDENFSILVLALDQAGLVETFASDGQYTVFAPTNAAFAALIAELDGVDSADDLLGLPNLKSILLYHVAPGRRFARTVTKQKRITTLNGGFLEVNGTVLTDANGRTSNIIATDIPASNGVIHVIDTVVLP